MVSLWKGDIRLRDRTLQLGEPALRLGNQPPRDERRAQQGQRPCTAGPDTGTAAPDHLVRCRGPCKCNAPEIAQLSVEDARLSDTGR